MEAAIVVVKLEESYRLIELTYTKFMLEKLPIFSITFSITLTHPLQESAVLKS